MKNGSSPARLSPQLAHLYICLSGCKLVEAAVNGWSVLLLGEPHTLSSAILILQGCSKVDLLKTSTLLLLSPKSWVQQLIRTQIKNVKFCNAFKRHLQHGKKGSCTIIRHQTLTVFFWIQSIHITHTWLQMRLRSELWSFWSEFCLGSVCARRSRRKNEIV